LFSRVVLSLVFFFPTSPPFGSGRGGGRVEHGALDGEVRVWDDRVRPIQRAAVSQQRDRLFRAERFIQLR
jgi:hypothetical protein